MDLDSLRFDRLLRFGSALNDCDFFYLISVVHYRQGLYLECWSDELR